MNLLRILALAILFGAAAAIAVWFAWGIAANFLAWRRARRDTRPCADATDSG